MTAAADPGTAASWLGRRVLVTGATGLVGSWVVRELLERGTLVVALVQDLDPRSELVRSGDIREVAVVDGEVEDFRTVERAVNLNDIEVVFHLAAQTIVGAAHRAPLQTFEANVRGTYNLLEACRLHARLVERVVVASSDKAYGESSELPYTERSPLLGRHPYEVSKACADLIAQSYYRTYRLPVAIARCGNVYGGGDLNWSRLVPGTIRSLLRREPPVIRSDGTYVRDYFYVKDAALSYIALAERLTDERVMGEAFNFGIEQPMTTLEMVATIQGLMGAEHLEPEIRDAAVGEIHAQFLSARKAREMLGWEPHYGLERGLGETIDWYRALIG